MRRNKYRVTLTQVAGELNITRARARKLLAKVEFAYKPVGSPPTWDHRVVDLLLAIRGLSHRPLEPAHQDWLARYQKENA